MKFPGTSNNFPCEVAIIKCIVQMRELRLGEEGLSWATQGSMVESLILRHRDAWISGSAGEILLLAPRASWGW